MDYIVKLTLVLILFDSGNSFLNAFPTKDNFGYCENIVKKWASSLVDFEVKEDKHTLQDLLFFLHIPRTGGRTYFHCFLRKLYSSDLLCPRSYDKLHFDPSKPKCKLLVTHDDYSVTSKLPNQKTSIVTILRNPLDRIFSTYEFSIEVAARFLIHPTLKSAMQMTRRMQLKTKGVSTLDIWPWKYLVPWMREDLFARRDARKHKGLMFVTSNNSYNIEDVVMPLHEYINDPIAKDIIHNGATFQVAGLTNNSYMSESHEVRHCVQKHKSLGHYVLEVAMRRLDEMLYVGITEDHRDSATTFANVVGSQVISQMTPRGSGAVHVSYKNSDRSLPFPDSNPESNHFQNNTRWQNAREMSPNENSEATYGNMTVGELMDSYGDCLSNLWKSQLLRRTDSLKSVSPANFSKQARLEVPSMVLEHIISLNSLDVALYKHAQGIFARQHKNTIPKLALIDSKVNKVDILNEASSWKVMSIATFIVLIFLILFINRRRKIKI